MAFSNLIFWFVERAKKRKNREQEEKLIYDDEYFPFQYSSNEFRMSCFFVCMFFLLFFFFAHWSLCFFAFAKNTLTRDFSCDDALDSYFLLRLLQNAKLICKLTPFCILIRGTLPKDIVWQKRKKESKNLPRCITKQAGKKF